MHRSSCLFAASALALALVGLSAGAQTQVAPSAPSEVTPQPGAAALGASPGSVRQSLDAVPTLAGDAPAAPAIHQDRGVSYVSGGVGEGEREWLAVLAHDFNLELEMAQTNRAYVADVKIAITDMNGHQVLNAMSGGPIFYAQLPPGRYQISATTQDGRTVSKRIRLAGYAQRKVELRWSPEGPIA